MEIKFKRRKTYPMDGFHIGNEQRWLLKLDQCELLSVVDVARDFRFFKACAIARFQNQIARGPKSVGSHLKLNICMPFVIISTVKSWLIYQFHWYLSYIITVPAVHHPTKLQYPHFELIFGDFAPAIAVITVEPAGKASFVLGCIQTRLMGQYNGK